MRVLGCSNGSTGSYCSNSSILTEDEFTYDGTNYVVKLIFLRSTGRLELELTEIITDTTEADLTLDVDGTTFAFSAANVVALDSIRWDNSGLSWSAGSSVALKLTAAATSATAPPAPTGLSATRGPYEVTLSWTSGGDGGRVAPGPAQGRG